MQLIDIGGSGIKSVQLPLYGDPNLSESAMTHYETPNWGNFVPWLAENGLLDCEHIGISCAGFINSNGLIKLCRIAGWENVNLVNDIKAYYGDFTVGGGGTRPLVVSYASSPPAEVYYAETPPAEAPTASIVAPGTCFRQVEFVGILKGTANQALAEQFIDFILSEPFQADIPLNMFVFPANEQVPLPDVFSRWAQIPEEPVRGDAAAIYSRHP